MFWTVLGTIAFVVFTAGCFIAAEFVLGAIGGSTGLFVGLFARGIWGFAGSMESKGLDDPVYKKNLRRLIERNRRFEEARKARHEPHS